MAPAIARAVRPVVVFVFFATVWWLAVFAVEATLVALMLVAYRTGAPPSTVEALLEGAGRLRVLLVFPLYENGVGGDVWSTGDGRFPMPDNVLIPAMFILWPLCFYVAFRALVALRRRLTHR